MVDIFNITNYERSERQLQLFLIFSIAVAGHNAITTDRCISNFFNSLADDKRLVAIVNKLKIQDHPLAILREAVELGLVTGETLKSYGLGRYNLLVKSFEYIGKELTKVSTIKHLELDDLLKIPGVGPKTARFFLLHSKRGARIAAIDTHILKFLRDSNVPNVPEATPGNMKEYLRLEKAFLDLVPTNKTPAEFDLAIWKLYRSGGSVNE